MTEESYQHNVRRRVTGPNTDTCLLASYDRISRVTGLTPDIYERSEQLRDWFVDACGDDGNHVPRDFKQAYAELKRQFWAQLGVPTPRNIVGLRVNTLEDLGSRLHALLHGGYRPTVYLDTGGLHAVGGDAYSAGWILCPPEHLDTIRRSELG